MKWLLDTCVVSELVRPKPAASVIDWLAEREEETLFLSVLTIGELDRGISRLAVSAKRSALEQWVRSALVERFGSRLLAVSADVAARWGSIAGVSDSKGQPVPVIDALIAATSLVNDCVVVTRNTLDFERCGARCINPWLVARSSTRPIP